MSISINAINFGQYSLKPVELTKKEKKSYQNTTTLSNYAQSIAFGMPFTKETNKTESLNEKYQKQVFKFIDDIYSASKKYEKNKNIKYFIKIFDKIEKYEKKEKIEDKAILREVLLYKTYGYNIKDSIFLVRFIKEGKKELQNLMLEKGKEANCLERMLVTKKDKEGHIGIGPLAAAIQTGDEETIDLVMEYSKKVNCSRKMINTDLNRFFVKLLPTMGSKEINKLFSKKIREFVEEGILHEGNLITFLNFNYEPLKEPYYLYPEEINN